MSDRKRGDLIRVLYIDDDAALVRLVQKVLARRGYEVVHAENGGEALRRLAQGDIDVAALDHYLSDMTGLELLKALEGSPGLPAVVYVTGSAEMSVAVAALKSGAADFVPKTVGDDFLVLLDAALRQAVEKKTLEAQKEAAERQVRMERDRAELLLQEVNHRVANSLTLVASLVNLQANAVDDQAARDALAETQARIYAVSLVHKRLYSTGEVGTVSLDEYLAGLLDHLGNSMRSQGLGSNLRYALEPVRLKTDASVNLGVVVTEWVTNAFKYAYPDSTGEIRVALRKLPGEKVELTVEDDGIGKIDSVVHGSGLGSRIVTAMASSMAGEARYVARNPGTTACLVFSIPPSQV
ncbi:MAG: sensor histidine kinase [Parvibaculaceae bacterium]|jgi:two-component sensor histidine kinase/CheY-like chemotaxis protein